MKKRRILSMFLVLVLVATIFAVIAPTNAIAQSDPFHKNLDDSYVGWNSTDDGDPIIYTTYIVDRWIGWVYVPITINSSAQNITRYLNVVLDYDSIGSWCNQGGEWIVRNYPVHHNPGQTIWYCIGGFSGVKSFHGLHWLRVTLSDSQITANVPNGWDGKDTTGGKGFKIGETEDWLLKWHYPSGKVPPHNTTNATGPDLLPGNVKAVSTWQSPRPPHKGHFGNFEIVVRNEGTKNAMVTWGPRHNLPGNLIIINIEDLARRAVPVRFTLRGIGNWEFVHPPGPPSHISGSYEIGWDPAGVNVIVGNVGDYTSPTSSVATGIEYEDDHIEVGGTEDPVNKLELLTPSIISAIVILSALVVAVVYFKRRTK